MMKAFCLLAAVMVPASSSALEAIYRDNSGTVQSYLSETPSGRVVIKDMHGVETGSISTTPSGRVVVKDVKGIERGTITRRR
jgi:hypothetical protein